MKFSLACLNNPKLQNGWRLNYLGFAESPVTVSDIFCSCVVFTWAPGDLSVSLPT